MLSGPLRVSMIMNFCVEEPHFVSQISQPPGMRQKWFCIQNLRMDLSFISETMEWNYKYFISPEIRTKTLNTKPFLADSRGLIYL